MSTTRWALLVGPKHLGSPVVRPLAARLTTLGLRVAGFVQSREGEAGGERITLERLGKGDVCPVARSATRSPAPGEELHCELVFDAGAFAQARAWVEADAPGADLVIVDCAGKLEASGRGHHATIVELLAGSVLPLLVVREDHLFAVMEAFRLDDEPVAMLGLPCADGDLDGFATALRRVVTMVS